MRRIDSDGTGAWRRPARRLAAVAAAACLTSPAVAPTAAPAKGIGQMAAPRGVAVGGSPYRYVALSPGTPGRVTVVARVDRDDGVVGRWWHLRGPYQVPAVAYDGTGGGLSGDGGTLVLSRFSRVFPPPVSRFAILDTRRSFRWRGPGPAPRSRRFARPLALRGDYSFHAISPDGSTLYLDFRDPRNRGPAYIASHRLRAVDVATGRLLPGPVSPATRRVEGLPAARATSLDGRWAHTLYYEGRGTPHLLTLDTASGRAFQLALPKLRDRHDLFTSRLRMRDGGRRLVVTVGARESGGGVERQLLSLDAASLAVATDVAGAAEGLLGRALDTVSGWLAIRHDPLLDFARAPRRPGNLLARFDVVGRSPRGLPIRLRQYGDPAWPGELLAFGCVRRGECGAAGLQPLTGGCPDPSADVFVVPELDPDGTGPQTRLAARIVRALRPRATLWFRQRGAERPYVRAWGASVPIARRFAELARMRFRLAPWRDDAGPSLRAAPFADAGPIVVELPPGRLDADMRSRLGKAVVRMGRWVRED